MRTVVLILVTLQQLLSGVAGVHAHADHNASSGHVSRPHVHLSGHSHHPGHAHSKHGHSHGVADENLKPASIPVYPNDSDHDRDAVFVSSDFFTASVPRTSIPDPLAACDVSLASDSFKPKVSVCLTRDLNDGLSGRGASARFRLLPHQLRV